jgi:hypothetical protein
MGIGGNPKKGRPGQPESGVWDRCDLNRSMGELADCAVLDIGLGKLVGVKVERLYYECNREQAETYPHHPTLGWSQMRGITWPESHFGLLGG